MHGDPKQIPLSDAPHVNQFHAAVSSSMSIVKHNSWRIIMPLHLSRLSPRRRLMLFHGGGSTDTSTTDPLTVSAPFDARIVS